MPVVVVGDRGVGRTADVEESLDGRRRIFSWLPAEGQIARLGDVLIIPFERLVAEQQKLFAVRHLIRHDAVCRRRQVVEVDHARTVGAEAMHLALTFAGLNERPAAVVLRRRERAVGDAQPHDREFAGMRRSLDRRTMIDRIAPLTLGHAPQRANV